MKLGLSYPYSVGTILPFDEYKRYDDTIFVFGDSFAEVGSVPVDDLIKTWLEMLAHCLSFNVRSFGVGGSSQQLIFDIFNKTLKLKRVFTIIFHTEYHREDNLSGEWLPKLEISDYKKWDSLLNEKTLHIFRDKEHQVYDFKNGKTHYCPHWKNSKTNIKVQNQKYKKVAGSNHMTYYGNLLLTKDIVEIIGDDLRFNG